MTKKHREAPIDQPGGEVLHTLFGILLRWARGEVYSDEAIEGIGDIVARDEFFEGLLECAGWKRAAAIEE